MSDTPRGLSRSRKAFALIVAGMLVIAAVNIVIGLYSFPFDAHDAERQRLTRGHDAGVEGDASRQRVSSPPRSH